MNARDHRSHAFTVRARTKKHTLVSCENPRDERTRLGAEGRGDTTQAAFSSLSIVVPSALATAGRRSWSGRAMRFSQWEMAVGSTPRIFASSSWVSPNFSRSARIRAWIGPLRRRRDFRFTPRY